VPLLDLKTPESQEMKTEEQTLANKYMIANLVPLESQKKAKEDSLKSELLAILTKDNTIVSPELEEERK